MKVEMKEQETAKCRWCKTPLIGKPYHLGGGAYYPKSFGKLYMQPVPVNQYGGYVCSYQCDYRASEELEGTMPGRGGAKNLSCFAQASLKRNWPNY